MVSIFSGVVAMRRFEDAIYYQPLISSLQDLTQGFKPNMICAEDLSEILLNVLKIIGFIDHIRNAIINLGQLNLEQFLSILCSELAKRVDEVDTA
jgi:hypothetical protein